jgi:hypothetical protein
MPQKHTTEEIKKIVEKNGDTLIYVNRINKRTILEIKCSQGHLFSTRYEKIKSRGSGCSVCAGNKKHTIESIRTYFKEKGETLLSEEYINNNQRLKIECSQGHIYERRWGQITQGWGCHTCDKENKPRISKGEDSGKCEKKSRTATEILKLKLEEKGDCLLDEKYIYSYTKYSIRCSQGHVYQMTWDGVRRGNGCPDCANTRLSIEFVRTEIEKRGQKLISKEYKNACGKIDVECGNGHTYKTTWNRIQRGRGCHTCFIDRKKLSFQFVKEQINAKGSTLLSKEYINSAAKLDVECPNGHIHKTSWAMFDQGHGCNQCAVNDKKHSVEYIRIEVEKSGYSLLSHEYINDAAKLSIKCDCDHCYKASWNAFKSGRRCPVCAERGFNRNKPAILYYLRFEYDSRFYYKIGITNRTVNLRFKQDKVSYKIINQTYFECGDDALEQETKILREYKRYKYEGVPFLKGGNSELFTEDILLLDEERIDRTISNLSA